ncbi:MAG: HAD-IIA family hydrolase [Euryarchaeota archaeon]|jgi:4-nitrophenyl phosphatase/NagD protein|nr:HAD-IIA family hydrolase [Euryarchaeota archaeon]MBT6640808.1 HAD-IIA family hydrolase [Euryarchaeota archaeon]MBT6845494.1 HAD-IIA family hydrolase [Euryarchaeota archaeon]MBT7063742.1 HAD-IIA family hydrolase [Euryarchaeota archaeon]MBT7263420.1 HAD-IIA family hydrolase [Euryarchaeota archaeon]
MDAQLNGIDAVFLDLDGTIYLGGNLIDGALDFLKRCDERGIKRYFLSNNSSRSVKQYVEKLHGFGIPAVEDDVLLSTHDLLAWLASNTITKTWLIGTEGMREMLEDSGIETRSEEPEYVVLGYDTEINYEKLSKASVFLHAGVPLVASHPDMVCPSPDGGLPDVGAYLALLKTTTGIDPIHITGKPNAGMILHKIDALGLDPARCAMVGDRLYTDLAMATRAGCVGILVLSGEATIDDVSKLEEGAEQQPTIIVNSVGELLR